MKRACQKGQAPIGPSFKLAADICFLPSSGAGADMPTGPSWAITGLMSRSKPHHYSITSSARTSNEGGTVRPSALAVFMLITSANLVGRSTGRSEGLVPLRILST